MLSKGMFAVYSVSFYLLVYCILQQFETTAVLAFFMLLLSPVLVCWMVYTVIKYDEYSGRELGEDEFGYQDKMKTDLGVF